MVSSSVAGNTFMREEKIMAMNNEEERQGDPIERLKRQMDKLAEIMAQDYERQGASPDNAMGLASLESLARMGEVEAMYSLGRHYEEGEIIPQNYSAAAKWYHEATEKGDEHSQFNLDRLAKMGNAHAQYLMGLLYSESSSVSQNPTKAVEWFNKAAEQSHKSALLKLAFIYTDGKNMPLDYEKATMMFRKIAGHESYEPMPTDLQKAAFWYRKAFQLSELARNGDADAQYELALMQIDGIQGIPPEKESAMTLFNMAAKQGHSGAEQVLQKYS